MSSRGAKPHDRPNYSTPRAISAVIALTAIRRLASPGAHAECRFPSLMRLGAGGRGNTGIVAWIMRRAEGSAPPVRCGAATAPR
jgi:hypothetical protein